MERRRREITLGLIALALVAGLAWALRDPGALGLDGAGERFVIAYDAGRDLTTQDLRLAVGALTLNLEVAPRPIRPLTSHTLRLSVTDGARAVALDDVEIAFNMEMDMGRHVYRALPDGGVWRADVVLPVCAWGGVRWYARVRFTAGGERLETIVILDVPRAAAL